MRYIVSFLLLSVLMFGQSPEEIEAREDLARQARRNMREIERLLASLQKSNTPGKDAAEATKRGKQVVNDIDELVKFFNPERVPSPDKGRQQKSSPQKKEVGQEKVLGKKKGEGNSQPGSGSPSPKKSENKNTMADRWGRLPKEVRQKLLDSKTKMVPTEYEKMIRRYIKRISNPGVGHLN